MWIMLFLLLATILVLAPLAPAFIELVHPADVQALDIEYDHDRSVRRFAERFARIARAQILKLTVGGDFSPAVHAKDDDAHLLLIAAGEQPQLTRHELQQKTIRKRLIGLGTLNLPDDFDFLREIYSVGDVNSGISNCFRAVLADGSLSLAPGCSIFRWAHAQRIVISHDVKLYGRASAEQEIRFSGLARFERLNAPNISFGKSCLEAPLACVPKRSALLDIGAQVEQRSEEERIIAADNLALPPHSLIEGNLIVRGELIVGEGAMVRGNIKAYGKITLQRGATIHGALVSMAEILCKDHCLIDGPIMSEESVFIGPNVRIGLPTAPTSVSARFIRVEAENVIVYGTLWAQEHGMVVSRMPSKYEPVMPLLAI